MIHLLGIKKNTPVEIREKLSLSPKKKKEYTKKLLDYFEEVVILSTCNRTEIYYNSSNNIDNEIEIIFKTLNWDINLKGNCFHLEEIDTVKHLMEVVCGFHSKILGEDQILGQIKDSYLASMEIGSAGHILQRLFQEAITCGKKFRTEGKLYEIPVSSASIAVSEALKNNVKNIMVIGYGEVGSLVVKYALSSNIESLNLIVRDINKVQSIDDNRVKVMTYDNGREIINNMDCVISCTSAPHLIIEKKHINEYGNKIIIFDLAMPRDIDEGIKDYKRVKLYDIDEISSIDDENKNLRKNKMLEYKWIVKKAENEFLEWKRLREVSDFIKEMKLNSLEVIEERQKTLRNKCLNEKDIKVSEVLIKSTGDYYINRAIEVLKEEQLKGKGKECMSILEKIFLKKN